MIRQVKVSLAVSLLVAALLPACQDECSSAARDVRTGILFDIFAFGHDFSPFCAAGFETAQEHARWVADAWGEPPNPFDYKLFESRDDPCWSCSSPAMVGCADRESLDATILPERHEIAHAVRGAPCPTLLEEGWAQLYGNHLHDVETLGDLREAADSKRWGILPAEFYPLAARFVAFLLETRGLEGLKALCQQEIDSSESLDSALKKVFGQSLDEIEAEFSEYPTWSLGQLRQDQACEGTDVTSFPGSWSMNLECGAPGVEGRDDGRLVAHHLVELPQAGNYVFRFDATANFFVRLELRNCEREGMASIFFQTRHVYGYGTPKEVLFLDLPAGLYVFRLSREDSTDPLPLEIAVESWP